MMDHDGEPPNGADAFKPKHVILAEQLIDRMKSGRLGSLPKISRNLLIGCGVCLVALFLIFSRSSSSPQQTAVAAPLAVHTKAASMMPVPEVKAAPKTSMLQMLKDDAKNHNKKRHHKK